MKRFLIQLAIFVVPALAAFFVVFLSEGGYSDPFYLRFTSPLQKGLIIGTSRAAQGIIPKIVNEELHDVSSCKVYNYSFTASNSAFGKPYLQSIKKKLQPELTNGLFIVAVDPWSIALEGAEPVNDDSFPESDNFIALMDNVSINPNLQYLFNFYSEPYYNIILRRFRKNHMRVHDDGWLEVTVKMDSTTVKKRTEIKLKQYIRNVGKLKFSVKRYEYLKRTIQWLQAHGDVYIVRLPVHAEMIEIEKEMMPDFQERVNQIITVQHVPYLDMTGNPDRYSFTDGNHLHKVSSKLVSKEIADWIKMNVSKK
jgi:hypothetical protein